MATLGVGSVVIDWVVGVTEARIGVAWSGETKCGKLNSNSYIRSFTSGKWSGKASG